MMVPMQAIAGCRVAKVKCRITTGRRQDFAIGRQCNAFHFPRVTIEFKQ
jgi:hypothetical protein